MDHPVYRVCLWSRWPERSALTAEGYDPYVTPATETSDASVPGRAGPGGRRGYGWVMANERIWGLVVGVPSSPPP